ncbi:MAG TPA: T7 exonuclease [Bacteroidetes bacterium]|nr:T7 exonuclease [Bacteroidota bacterium]|tara:strand:- start:1390 stop:2109 length:720 start_codon:yes stop_codon:yes gene_type:complete
MLLIDSDFLAYKAAQACEIGIDFGEDVIIAQSQFSEVLKVFHNELNKVTKAMMEDNFILYFSSTKNFRKKIYPDYKGHRMKRKPLGYKRLVNYCRENHNFKLIEGLEADDTIGIEATRFADPNNIVVSPDKDMRQIPSTLWDMKDDVVEITKEDGDRWHLIQSLSGDPTDGYSGCPGIGVKRASELLDKNENKWEAVCKAYRDRGLSDDDALLNARLAKILQKEDFDHDRNQPILWTPN